MIRTSLNERYNKYIVKVKNGEEFFVRKGSNRIECFNRYTICGRYACIDNGLVLPDEIPPFKSFIQACIYAKQNAEALR